jgi:AcrR family transcriptional regulator
MPKRAYNSPRRDQAAEQTRAAILAAAERLFRERGFVATRLADVAAEAGVSLATVKVVFGTKRKLLEEAVRARVVDDTDGRPLNERQSWREMLAESDPQRLVERVVELGRELHERSAALIEAVERADAADPELAEIARRGGEKRHADTGEFVAALAERGALREGLDPARATDEVWALMAPSLYLQLTVERGWTPRAWAEFATESLKGALLRDD